MRILTSIPFIMLALGGLLVVTLAMYRVGKYRCEKNQSAVNWQYAWFTFGMIMLLFGVGTFVDTSTAGGKNIRGGGGSMRGGGSMPSYNYNNM